MSMLASNTSRYYQVGLISNKSCTYMSGLTLKSKRSYNSISFNNCVADIEKTICVAPGLHKNKSAWLFLHLIMRKCQAVLLFLSL